MDSALDQFEASLSSSETMPQIEDFSNVSIHKAIVELRRWVGEQMTAQERENTLLREELQEGGEVVKILVKRVAELNAAMVTLTKELRTLKKDGVTVDSNGDRTTDSALVIPADQVTPRLPKADQFGIVKAHWDGIYNHEVTPMQNNHEKCGGQGHVYGVPCECNQARVAALAEENKLRGRQAKAYNDHRLEGRGKGKSRSGQRKSWRKP